MLKCKYNQKLFDQPVDCLIENCEDCRFNPDTDKALAVIDKVTETELRRQEIDDN